MHWCVLWSIRPLVNTPAYEWTPHRFKTPVKSFMNKMVPIFLVSETLAGASESQEGSGANVSLVNLTDKVARILHIVKLDCSLWSRRQVVIVTQYLTF